MELFGPFSFRRICQLAAFVACASSSLLAQQEDLSVEEILGLQVTSVGRKAQQVANAPAAVYVITQEDIRRSGAANVQDVLRIVPGLVVARINGITWGISARGGTRQFANKMQVMIDGRPVYNRLFSGVFWDTQDLMLEDIDRIEVIRGVGAIMWGSNAVNGVIHIITKSARDTQGSLMTLGTGVEEQAFSSFRYGGKVGDKLQFRIWGKQNYRQFYPSGTSLIRRNPVSTDGAPQDVIEQSVEDQSGIAFRAGFRLDWQRNNQEQMQASGMIYANDTHIAGWYFGANSTPTKLRIDENSPGGNFQLRWIRTGSSGSETAVQFWADRSIRDSQLYRIRLDTADVELQHRRQLSENHELHLASGIRFTTDNLVGRQAFRFGESSRTDPLSNVTLRDEWQWLNRRLIFSAGIRFEHNAYTGFEWQPASKLLFAPNKSHSIWGGWSRAVRTPSRSEHDSSSVGIGQSQFQGIPVLLEYQGNRAFRSEVVREWSLGYRYQRRQHWSIDLSAFHNRFDRLASLELGRLNVHTSPELRLSQSLFTANGREGSWRGFELAGSASLTSFWKLHGSYSFLSHYWRALPTSTDPQRSSSRDDPRHQLKLRSLWNISQKWQFDVSTYSIDAIPAVAVPAYVRVDTRLGWRPNRNHDVSFVIQNALNERTIEFQSELFGYAVPSRRTAILRWTVRMR